MHLGAPDYESSLAREKKLVRWLEYARRDASAIYLLGDIFDFWFEYKRVVPRGYVRLLGKMAEIADSGVPLYVFAGNHDMWFRNYFPRELGVTVFHSPQTAFFYDKKYFLAHGDGLGPGDYGYKALKFVMRNNISQWLFERIPPTIGIALANLSSRTSRHTQEKAGKPDSGYRDYIHRFAIDYIKNDPSYDYFICGHIHQRRTIPLNEKSSLLLLGDWIADFSYLVIDEKGIETFIFND